MSQGKHHRWKIVVLMAFCKKKLRIPFRNRWEKSRPVLKSLWSACVNSAHECGYPE